MALATLGYGVQTAVGLLLVNVLSVEAFAEYSLVTSFLGAIGPLMTAGFVEGLTALCGPLAQQNKPIRSILYAALAYQQRFALVLGTLAIITCVAINRSILSGKGLLALSLGIALLSPVVAALHLRRVVLAVQYEFRTIQLANAGAAVFRFALVAGYLWFGGRSGLVAGLVAIPASLLLLGLFRWRTERVLRDQPIETVAVPSSLRQNAWRALPSAIFFSARGPVALWILAVLANQVAVAGLGAIGRFQAVSAIAGQITEIIVPPQVARAHGVNQVLYVIGKNLMIVATPPLVLVVLSWWVPGLVLSVLGQEYRQYETELLLFSLALLANTFGVLAYRAAGSLGVIPRPDIVIASQLLGYTVAAFALQLNTVAGVIKMELLIQFTTILVNLTYLVKVLRSHRFPKRV